MTIAKNPQHRFVVVTGLPGSGKSTLARRLAPALNLPLIDKDDCLERLFELHGAGDADWRRMLSRESDRVFQEQAMASKGAVLVSFWRMPGGEPGIGTPTDWLRSAPDRIVEVRCICSPELAAERFMRRKRHPGHLDGERPMAEILSSIQAIANYGPLEIGPRIDVDTTHETALDFVLGEIDRAFASSQG
jgi:hypothetical protein